MNKQQYMSKYDDSGMLGDRMKGYEHASDGRLMPMLPAMARLDGRAFSSFTRHAKKPFSETFLNVMDQLTAFLVKETGATVGYTQSDEITLCWHNVAWKGEVFFDGRVQKMSSALAAMASVWLNVNGPKVGPNDSIRSGLKWHSLPTFDCRVWNVPNLDEAVNTFIWRQQDAVRNSIQMLARFYYSHNELLNRSTGEMKTMLANRYRVLWEDLSPRIRRGTFVRKVKTSRAFTTDEIAKLPPLHQAHKDPNLLVVRSDYSMTDIWVTKLSPEERIQVLLLGAPQPKLYDTPSGVQTVQGVVDGLNSAAGYTKYVAVRDKLGREVVVQPPPDAESDIISIKEEL